MIKYLESSNFEEEIKKGKILVDFYADWCGPCKMLGEVLENMQDINILKVNVDLYPDIAENYGIMSIPTLISFEDGKEKNKHIGFADEDVIRKII